MQGLPLKPRSSKDLALYTKYLSLDIIPILLVSKWEFLKVAVLLHGWNGSCRLDFSQFYPNSQQQGFHMQATVG